MLYISSACVKHQKIRDSVEELASNGFTHIELSGGTKYYEGYEEDLIRLKDKYQLTYLLHSYFPPPKEDFVVNLASLDDALYQRTVEQYERAIALSEKLGARKYGFHAGFLVDLKPEELGGKASFGRMNDRLNAVKKFSKGYQHLKKISGNVELYIENNVWSESNNKTFQGQNPLLLTDLRGYQELRELIDFNLLLDIGHLKVSAQTLGLDFVEQFKELIKVSDYFHLSDNDGMEDLSRCFTKKSSLLAFLKGFDLSGKTITAETYGDIGDIKRSCAIITEELRLNELPELNR